MRHMLQRVAVSLHESVEHGVGDGLYAVVHGKYSAYVGVDHEAGQGAEQHVQVVGLLAASFGVSHGHDAVDVREGRDNGFDALLELAHEAACARGRAEQHDIVARAHAAASPAPIALEEAFGGKALCG